MKKSYFLFICTVTVLFLNCKNDDGSLPVDDIPEDVIENKKTNILDFSPGLGARGIQVTIRGENFDPLPEGNEVQFNGMTAEVESATENALVVTVPEDATTGKISLSANGYDYISFQDFTVLLPPPIISDFEPKTGVEGDEVTITGMYFGDNPNFVEVRFHNSDIPAEIVSITDEKLVVTANDANTGDILITVYGQNASTQEDFTYLPWRKRKDFEGAGRRFAFAEAIGKDIYMGTGSGNGLLADLWKYSPETDSWIQMADFPGVPRDGVFHFVIDGSLYVGGGTDNITETGLHDFFRFNPATNTWTQLEDFPGNPNQVRQFSSSFVVKDKGYVYGGWKAPNLYPTYNDLWEYNPIQDSWDEKAGFEEIGRAAAISFSIGDKGYIATGIDITDNRLGDVWEYDPLQDSWIEKKALPQGFERYGALGFRIDNKGYLGMGLGNYTLLNDFWEFDPSTNGGEGSWTKKSDFPSGKRYWPFAVAVNGKSKAYIGLGLQFINNVSEYPIDIWEYTPRHDE